MSGGQRTDPIRSEGGWIARYAVYASIFAAWIALIFLVTGGAHDADWAAHWKQWDSHWYEEIWTGGYRTDPRLLVFPPGYAYLIGFLSRLFSAAFGAVAAMVNLVALFAAAALIADWFAEQFEVSSYAQFAFVLSAPAAYFAFASYSDAVFMLLVWVALWLALSPRAPRGATAVAAQSGLLLVLPWVRLTGYALATWLLERRAAALATFASLAAWLAFNRTVSGDAFHFLRAQEIFAMPEGNFFSGLAWSFEQLVSNDLHDGYVASWLEFGLLPLLYLGALTGTAIWLARRGQGLLALTALSVLVLSHNQSVWRSVVRYDLPLVPVLSLPLLAGSGLLGNARLGKVAFYALLAGQLALQCWFARLFHAGAWAF